MCWCVGVLVLVLDVGPDVGPRVAELWFFEGGIENSRVLWQGGLALVLDPQVRRFCRTKTNLKSFKYGGMCC